MEVVIREGLQNGSWVTNHQETKPFSKKNALVLKKYFLRSKRTKKIFSSIKSKNKSHDIRCFSPRSIIIGCSLAFSSRSLAPLRRIELRPHEGCHQPDPWQHSLAHPRRSEQDNWHDEVSATFSVDRLLWLCALFLEFARTPGTVVAVVAFLRVHVIRPWVGSSWKDKAPTNKIYRRASSEQRRFWWWVSRARQHHRCVIHFAATRHFGWRRRAPFSQNWSVQIK